ncbi:MAG: type II toxin-antitoxin system RelE/ParE family toxin [Elsteraceae bacterium]
MQTVLFTSVFERHARRAGLSESELMQIVSMLAENPMAGDLIPGTGGARKVRVARVGQGKSGGYRTIHYFGGEDVPIFLLALIDKGERANLSMAERNELAIILPKIAQRYREAINVGRQPGSNP